MSTNDSATDDGTDAQTDEHFTPNGLKSAVSQAWKGAFLYDSWGYGQTNVEFAQITRVSDSGKTVWARLCTASSNPECYGSETVVPEAQQYGDEFELRVRECRGDPLFKGSHPLGPDGDMDDGTRLGSFSPYDKGDKGMHQTPANQGH